MSEGPFHVFSSPRTGGKGEQSGDGTQETGPGILTSGSRGYGSIVITCGEKARGDEQESG